MFKILNGREAFFQWDLNQKLIIEDASVNQVHFCNKTDDCSLVCEVYEEDGLRLANVPNILLQTDWDIRAYAYCDDCYTKVEQRFKVNARTRPADYVYTETEVLRFQELESRVDDTTSKAIANAETAAQEANAAADRANNSIDNINNTFANALKGSKSGSAILIDDVSPVTHEMKVKISPTPPKNLLNRLIAVPDGDVLNNPTETFINTYCSKKILFEKGKTYTFSVSGILGQINDTFSWQPRFYIYENGNLFISQNDPDIQGMPIYNYKTYFTTTEYSNEYWCWEGTSVWCRDSFIDSRDAWAMDITPLKTFEAIFIALVNGMTNPTILEPQIEVGSTATSYVPYTESPITDLTAVKVSRCGKNLIRFPYQETHDITTDKFTRRINSDGTIIFNGTLSSGGSMYLGIGDYYKPNLKPGVTYILSGVPSGTLIMRANKNDGTTKYINSGKAFVWSDNYTFSSLYILYPAGTVLENEVVKPQLEIGTTATDYESYISPTEYTPTADGTVNGVTSLYPNTTLTTDTEGVLIDCEYNRDINKAFAELQQAIISLGGNV